MPGQTPSISLQPAKPMSSSIQQDRQFLQTWRLHISLCVLTERGLAGAYGFTSLLPSSGLWGRSTCSLQQHRRSERSSDSDADGHAFIDGDSEPDADAVQGADGDAYSHTFPEPHANRKCDAERGLNAACYVHADGCADIDADGRSDVNADGRSDVNADGRSDVNADGCADIDADGRSDVNADGRSDGIAEPDPERRLHVYPVSVK